MSKIIALTQGKETIVDDEDFEYLSQWKWNYLAAGHGYARRGDGVLMHRLLENSFEGMDVDHINGNSLDNQRCNLRRCSKAENSRNHQLSKRNKSGHTGVCWSKQAKRWDARIMTNRKQIFLGIFDKKDDAIAAYQKAAEKYHGDFSRKN